MKKRNYKIDPNGGIHIWPDGLPDDVQAAIDETKADYAYIQKTGLCPQCKKNPMQKMDLDICQSCSKAFVEKAMGMSMTDIEKMFQA